MAEARLPRHLESMSSRNLRHSRPLFTKVLGCSSFCASNLPRAGFVTLRFGGIPFLVVIASAGLQFSSAISKHRSIAKTVSPAYQPSHPRDNRSPHSCVRVPGRKTLDEPEVRDLSSGTGPLRRPLPPSCASEGWTGAEKACIFMTALRQVLSTNPAIGSRHPDIRSRTPAPMAMSWSESGVRV